MKVIIISLALLIAGLLVSILILENTEIINWSAVETDAVFIDLASQSKFTNSLELAYISGLLPMYLNTGPWLGILISIFIFILGLVSFIHLLIDKLFYKKFYEEPNWRLAFRRSIMVGILTIVILILAIFNFINFAIIILLILGFILLELFLYSIIQKNEGK